MKILGMVASAATAALMASSAYAAEFDLRFDVCT